MAAKHGVLLIHGIGDQAPDWAAATARRLSRAVSAHAGRLLGGAASPADGLIAIRAVHWADILQARQQHLLRILAANQPPRAA